MDIQIYVCTLGCICIIKMYVKLVKQYNIWLFINVAEISTGHIHHITNSGWWKHPISRHQGVKLPKPKKLYNTQSLTKDNDYVLSRQGVPRLGMW